MPKQISRGKKWYAIHTYAGYEDVVARDLKRRVENTGMDDKIFSIIVPKEKKIKIRSGQRKIIEEKIYPGYVLVEMIVTDDSWYVVRNTPRVTGFVGSGVVPTPLSEAEINEIKKRMLIEEPKFKLNVSIGDLVKITDGPFKDSLGKISEIDEEHGRVKILVPMFGRETPVDMDFLQIKKA
ncbi:MAG TPA: transcription termination/antitermination factor NusG [Candidatus Portnoybacteria bacterium]|nr:transcription termination/antitermination factor NusG [Candidatus Portnoybacteria bacterium]